MNEEVIVTELEDGTFGIYDESGMCVEPDFGSFDSVSEWARDNGYVVIDSFYL